ncbi:MAG: hypothetical protein EON93_05755, partial [Burkholderiales bacterium]
YKTITNEVKLYLQGGYGKAPGSVSEKLRRQAIGSEEVIDVRPADLLKPEMAKLRKDIGELARNEEDVLTYAMFPDIGRKYLEERNAGTLKPEALLPIPEAGAMASSKGEGVPTEFVIDVHGETYRVDMGQPLLLEDLLRKHPKLRIYVMHYGSPFVDQMIAMMFTYPNLYVDVSCNNWAFPRAQFHDALKRMVDAGLEKRILFGSDQMNWPDAIGEAIKSIETAPFLSDEQKRDILYNNAARFLRLSEAEIAKDHQRGTPGSESSFKPAFRKAAR